MASTASQRTGLVTATAVATIVALTALVFAFIYSAKASKAEATMDELTKSYNNIVAKNAIQGPVATALRVDREAAAADPAAGITANDPLLNVAVAQRDNLTKLIGGASPQVAMTSGRDALAKANEAMKGAGLPEINVTDNLASAMAQVAGAVVSLHQQNVSLTAQAAASKDEAAKTVASAQASIEANNKAFDDARKSMAAETIKLNEDRGGMQGVQNASMKAFEDANKAVTDQLAKSETEKSDLIRDKQQMQKEVTTLRNKLDAYRPEAVGSLVRQPDGSISRISTDRTVYIDLGAGQQVVPGMTFEVYNKLEGVPALKADETSLPMGKASIEVVRVGANGAEARVIQTKLGQTITEGDVVANLVYDRNTKYNFVVYGKFDLSKKGSPAAEDAAVIKRLVTEFGGQTRDKVGVDTDFLVIGSEPVIPDFSEEQRRDPVNAKILADAQAEVDAYNAVVNRAKELFVPVLNQNRFLYYVGYFDKARR